MRNWIFAIAALMTPGMHSTSAQSTAPRAPTAPVLHRAPAFASWTINFKYQEDDTKSPAETKSALLPDRIQSITVTKTDSTYREQTVWKSGKTEEKWVFDGVELKSIAGTGSIVPLSPPTKDSPEPDYSDYSKIDFPGCEWIKLSFYKGTGSYQGTPVFLFDAMSGQREKENAALSTDSQLPLYCSDGEVTRIYTYNAPPTAPLVPPGQFLEVLRRYKQGIEALKYHPVPM